MVLSDEERSQKTKSISNLLEGVFKTQLVEIKKRYAGLYPIVHLDPESFNEIDYFEDKPLGISPRICAKRSIEDIEKYLLGYSEFIKRTAYIHHERIPDTQTAQDK